MWRLQMAENVYNFTFIMFRNGKLHSIYRSSLLKIRITSKKVLNASSSESNFVKNKGRERIWLSSLGVELGASKIHTVEILHFTKAANYIQFIAQRCQKYASHLKKLQMKVVQNRISYIKVPACICLSPSGADLGVRKIHILEKFTLYRNGKLYSI